MKKTPYVFIIILLATIIMFNNANPEVAGAKKVTWYLTPQFDKVYSFLEDMAAVQKDGKWGFINRAGKIVIKPQFNETYGFNEGLAPVQKGVKWGFINKSGRVVISIQFSRVFEFSEGLAAAFKDVKFGFIDKEGKMVIDPQFEFTFSFHEGMAAVFKNGRWGYINREGRMVIDPQFDSTYCFSEGLAHVKKNNKWGYINREGKMIIDPQFDETYGFNEGLAPAKKGNKWGFIINPLSVQKQEQSLASAGLYIGDIKSVSKTELMVGGKDIAVRVVMGDKLCLYSADKLIILRAVFPMMTLAKCEVISGNRNGVKPGMKVYKYTGGKRQQ